MDRGDLVVSDIFWKGDGMSVGTNHPEDRLLPSGCLASIYAFSVHCIEPVLHLTTINFEFEDDELNNHTNGDLDNDDSGNDNNDDAR